MHAVRQWQRRHALRRAANRGPAGEPLHHPDDRAAAALNAGLAHGPFSVSEIAAAYEASVEVAEHHLPSDGNLYVCMLVLGVLATAWLMTKPKAADRWVVPLGYGMGALMIIELSSSALLQATRTSYVGARMHIAYRWGGIVLFAAVLLDAANAC